MIPQTDCIWISTEAIGRENGEAFGAAVDLTAYIYQVYGFLPADPTKWPAMLPRQLHKSRRSAKRFKRKYRKILRYFWRLPNGTLAPDPQYISISEPDLG